jgi:hypothetical protein
VQPKQDTDWILETWNPQARKAGLTHIAFIMPEHTFTKASISKYKAGADKKGDVSIGVFTTIGLDYSWYMNQ